MVTWPEQPPSKYFAAAWVTRSLIRDRSASPISMFFPDTRNILASPPGAMVRTAIVYPFTAFSTPLDPGEGYRISGMPAKTREVVPPSRSAGGCRAKQGGWKTERVAALHSRGCAERGLLLLPSLHGGRNSHGLPVFCDGPPSDVDTCIAQPVHYAVI